MFDQRDQKVVGTQINVVGNPTLPPPPLVLVPHLPPPPRDFTGRDEELQDLLAGFERGATITGLRGMGGIGKTALAYALAETLAGRYPDGQILVELRGTDPVPMTAAEAMARVIRAYHPQFKPPESEAELGNIYHSVLHEMRALLLLDNAADDRQVRPLLPPQSCGVIVTSRRKFSLPGLVPKDLDVLRTDEAIELLLKLWKPGASPSTEQLGDEDLLEIARLCGFLPLALRAAGSLLANSPDLSPAQYARDLQDELRRQERIGKEGVDLDVESSFGLSYSRLKPETAAVFRILSVFPASFDAAAEEVVCLDEGHRHLSELVRWSLAEYQSSYCGGRYHMHDLVRIFASSRLPSEEKAEAEERHAEHYRSVLSASDEQYKQGGENLLAGLALFDQEWANIQAGWAWAERSLHDSPASATLCSSYPNAGAYVLDLRLHPREKIRWLETAVAAARKKSDRGAEGRHLGNLGGAYADLGELRKAIEHYDQALKITREIGDRTGEGNALGSLGLAYADLGEPRKAIEYHEKALEIAREIGDRRGEGNRLGNLGIAYASLGEPRKAIDYYDQALKISREIGNRRGEGAVLGNLGLAYADLGDPRKAIEYHEKALKISREIGDRRGEGADLGNLGNAYASLGEPRKAIEYHEKALKIAREIGDRRNEGNWLGSLGLAYAILGEPRKAIDYYDQALEIAREIGDRRGEGNRLGNLGLAYASLDEPRKAIEYYDQALEIAREIGDRRGEGADLGNLGLAYASLDEPRKAIEYYDQALEIAREIGDRRGEGADLGNLGLAYASLDEPRKAIEYHGHALKISREIGDRRGEGADLGNLGRAYAALGETHKAIEHYEQALAIAKEIGDRRGEGNALFNMSLAQDSLGKRAEAVKLAKEALQIYEQIESPYAERVRQQLAEWQG
jgi:tetratricopeptide (TPR) repeat protein